MTNYLLVYSGGSTPESEAEQAAVMQAWGTWLGGMGDALVDGGNPTIAAVGIASDRSVGEAVVPGVTGYSVISAESMNAAVAIAKGCPIFDSNGQVSVYETMDM